MNVETVTRPIGKLREQVLRLGERVVSQSRLAGEVALRGGASALTRTAQRLDTLADRIAEGEKSVAVDAEPPASAEPVSAEPVSAEPVSAEPVSAEPVSAEPVSAEPVSVETPPAQGTSTTEAHAQGGSKKKHRQNRRPR